LKTAVVALKRSIRTVLFALTVRVVIYAVLLAAIAYGCLWGAVVYDEAFYDELGPVEILETVFALSAALIFLLAGRREPSKEPCAVMIAGLLFCAFVRESDFIMDTLVAKHSWKIGVALILIGMILYAAKHLRKIYVSVLKFVHLPSFGIFLSGLLVLAAFSRLFGYGPFWKAIMDHPSYRTVKTIVEEGVELMGYFLILIAACEYYHHAKIRRRGLNESNLPS
jgi:hypothetical protein